MSRKPSSKNTPDHRSHEKSISGSRKSYREWESFEKNNFLISQQSQQKKACKRAHVLLQNELFFESSAWLKAFSLKEKILSSVEVSSYLYGSSFVTDMILFILSTILKKSKNRNLWTSTLKKKIYRKLLIFFSNFNKNFVVDFLQCFWNPWKCTTDILCWNNQLAQIS